MRLFFMLFIFIFNCSTIQTLLKKKELENKEPPVKEVKKSEKESYDTIEDPYRVLRD